MLSINQSGSSILSCTKHFYPHTQALDALRLGKAIIFPTDTVMGIGVSVEHAQGPEEIFTIKGRVSTKPVAWLVGSVSDLARYGNNVPDWACALAQAFWPGPLTLIVQASDLVATSFQSQAGTIGLRMPNNEEALQLLRDLGCAIATSSANVSGASDVTLACQVDKRIASLVPVVLEATGAQQASGCASTVLDCTGPRPNIVRLGSVTQKDIDQVVAAYL